MNGAQAMTNSLLACDHGIRLAGEQDALDAMSSGLPGCIFKMADVCDEYFDLANGIAGATFQKFVNYGYRVAFVIPEPEGMSIRVQELMRDHRRHPNIRFFENVSDAESWITGT